MQNIGQDVNSGQGTGYRGQGVIKNSELRMQNYRVALPPFFNEDVGSRM